MQRTLNRNSWHFKLAEILGVVDFHPDGAKEENGEYRPIKVMNAISLCEYVRGLILKGFFLAVLTFMATAITTGLILSAIQFGLGLFGYGFIFEALQHFAKFGTAMWIAVLICAGFLGITIGGPKFIEYFKKRPKAEKISKEDGFWHMVQTVHKEKICYTLK
ncbi:hypothetical protein D3C87_279200 [compost metagenome]